MISEINVMWETFSSWGEGLMEEKDVKLWQHVVLNAMCTLESNLKFIMLTSASSILEA